MRGVGGAWGVLMGIAVLAVVLVLTGIGPVVVGVRSLDAATLALGTLLAVPATIAGAWRWHLVARGLGVGVGLGAAVAGCYRAQFLNVTLPGGVVGDVHRGVSHGRGAGDTGRGLRSVAYERLAGQVVLTATVVTVLLLFPSPVRSWLPLVLGVVIAGCLVAGWLLRRAPAAGASTRLARVLRVARSDVRLGLLARDAWPGILLASVLALGAHLATYLLAAHAVGVSAPLSTLVPLALLVLLAAGLPTNVAGWGPREGAAAWAFGAAGLGADQGLATAVAYAAMVLVASLPGAAVLLLHLGRRAGVPAAAQPLGQSHG